MFLINFCVPIIIFRSVLIIFVSSALISISVGTFLLVWVDIILQMWCGRKMNCSYKFAPFYSGSNFYFYSYLPMVAAHIDLILNNILFYSMSFVRYDIVSPNFCQLSGLFHDIVLWEGFWNNSLAFLSFRFTNQPQNRLRLEYCLHWNLLLWR